MIPFSTLFQPLLDALSLRLSLPWKYRWRLICFQPLACLIYAMTGLPWAFSKRFTTLYIPTRSGQVRALLFNPPKHKNVTTTPNDLQEKPTQQLRPLHLDLHGSAFLWGFAEINARWCSQVSDTTGAVVISGTYRFAPRHTFPAAHDDVDDIVHWLMQNAESKFGADPTTLTMSGSSAGASLCLSAANTIGLQSNGEQRVRGFVGFYTPIDFRYTPAEKPRSADFPKSDPSAWLFPLFDSYVFPTRPVENTNPRLHPILSETKTLPENMFFVVPAIDILVHEQLTFVERVKKEIEETKSDEHGSQKAMTKEPLIKRLEVKVFEKCFHGWLELPSIFIDESTRIEAFNLGCRFLNDVYREQQNRT